MKNLLIIICVFHSSLIYSQEFDIRFSLQGFDCENNTVCYDVQLRNANGSNWFLAGQNYRIYYNSALASYQSGTSSLPQPTYGDYTLVQDIQNTDASSVGGPLSFEGDLGFLNYFMDLNNVISGAIFLTSDWTTTSNLCFTVDASVFAEDDICIELVWARDGLTNPYATAFVEVSEWTGPNSTTAASGNIYDDLDSSDGEGACFETSCDIIPDYTADDVTINEEDGTATVTVCLDEAASNDVDITYSTSDDSAVSGSDYTSVSNMTLTIPQGQLCGNIVVNIIDDSNSEPTETFNINITNVTGANLSDAEVVVTINDNDVACDAQAPGISGN